MRAVTVMLASWQFRYRGQSGRLPASLGLEIVTVLSVNYQLAGNSNATA